MQTVEQVQEELKRFNPKARIPDEIEIIGVSPETECHIQSSAIEKLEARIEQLERDLEEAKSDYDEIECKYEDLKQITAAQRNRQRSAILKLLELE